MYVHKENLAKPRLFSFGIQAKFGVVGLDVPV